MCSPITKQLYSLQKSGTSTFAPLASGKLSDATALEAELIRIAVAMEASMLRKCGENSSQANAQEPIDDISAIREQTCSIESFYEEK